MAWTSGKALIGTGSPFPPVKVGGQSLVVAQTNNSYIFPGVSLGIIASRARRVTDKMFMADQAQKDGVAGDLGLAALVAEIQKIMWVPEYRLYRRVESGGAHSNLNIPRRVVQGGTK